MMESESKRLLQSMLNGAAEVISKKMSSIELMFFP